MDIRLKPELEKLVEQDVQRGPYQTADEFVERAVVLLHEQETWLAEHAAEIGAKISEGYAAAKRGELIDAERARSAMEEKKRAWLTDKRLR
jgi:putative addiction module CopG family antidote